MKTLGWFLVRFVIALVLLASPWPGLRSVAGAGVRAQARFLTGFALPQSSFRIEPYVDAKHPTVDTVVILRAPKRSDIPDGKNSVEIPFDSIGQVWMPFAMLIALTIATPLPWIQRLKALVIGGLLIEVLIVATIVVSVSFALQNEDSPAWSNFILLRANHLLFENVWFSFVAPFLVWAAWIGLGGHWEKLATRDIAQA